MDQPIRTIRILHLEDDPGDAELIRAKLGAEDPSCDIVWVDGKAAFESALGREAFDLVLIDYNLPGYDGMSALARVREERPELPVIVLSGALGEEVAVECLKAGATDFVLKQQLHRLGAAARAALERSRLAREAREAENALRESEARFRTLTEMSSDFYWESDPEHRLTRRGSAGKSSAATVFARPTQIGERRWEIPCLAPDEAGWQAHRAVLDAHLPFRDFVFSRLGSDGAERHLSISGDPVFDASGTFMGHRGVGTDITERKQAFEKIKRLNRVHAVLSGINAAIIRIGDRDELYRATCRIAVEHGGFGSAQMLLVDEDACEILPGASAGADVLPAARASFRPGEETIPTQGTTIRAIRERKPVFANDIAAEAPIGTLRPEAVRRGYGSVISLPLMVREQIIAVLLLWAREKNFFNEEEVRLLSAVAGDVSFALDHIEKTNQLDYLAYHDSVAGLANRALFLERVNQHVRVAGPAGAKIAVVLADIERLRTINESLSRQAGDAVIREFARRLAHATGAAALGRVSGDHFAIILQAVKGKSEVARRFEAIWRDCLSTPFIVGKRELWITAKAGIALYPNDAADPDALLRNAEAALSKGKDLGERYMFYRSALTEGTAERLTLESRLRRALVNDEFVLHYQPKVDAETRRVAGVEALIRWQSPELGLVPPAQFIPLMEETGLILQVGSWALKQASLDHRRWVEQGIKAPRVAVNVSAIQLRQRDFVAAVEQAIMEGVAPTGIDLEITESLVMEDVKSNIEKLKSVRQLGVKIAIDDFGTGYSSLGYLAKLPVQSLKIDRSFIITMLDDADTMTLVSTIISLAHSLRLKVVAEGVDAEEQAKYLRLLRCDEMQGYLFSRPVPFEEMTALLKQPAPD